MPFLAILAAGMVSHALSGNFETFYPVRLVAGAGALILYRHELATLDWRWSWRGPAVGALVFLTWIIAAHWLLPRGAMPAALTALPPAMRVLWIASRATAAIVTVPIAEELAYRGYLMRRLMTKEFDTLPFHAVLASRGRDRPRVRFGPWGVMVARHSGRCGLRSSGRSGERRHWPDAAGRRTCGPARPPPQDSELTAAKPGAGSRGDPEANSIRRLRRVSA